MAFGTFSPIVAQSNNKVFGGRDNNQVGDVFMGIFAGVRVSKSGKEIYVFIDETDNMETIIFNCQSLQQGLLDSGANIGSRVAIQLAGRFESSAKSKCGAGKIIVRYQVQCDPEFVITDSVRQMVHNVMSKVSEPQSQAKPQAPKFGTFASSNGGFQQQQPTESTPRVPFQSTAAAPQQFATTKKPNPFM